MFLHDKRTEQPHVHSSEEREKMFCKADQEQVLMMKMSQVPGYL